MTPPPCAPGPEHAFYSPNPSRRALNRASLASTRAATKITRASRPFSLNQTGTLLRRHLAHFVPVVDSCNLQIGDVIGSGAVSGPGEGEAGVLSELSKAGNAPVPLGAGEERAFLEDGDTVTLSGYCAKDGFARIGFGDCVGEARPAPTL